VNFRRQQTEQRERFEVHRVRSRNAVGVDQIPATRRAGSLSIVANSCSFVIQVPRLRPTGVTSLKVFTVADQPASLLRVTIASDLGGLKYDVAHPWAEESAKKQT
jgi:hypothetical protein